MAQRNIKARYQTKYLGKQKVKMNKSAMVKDPDTGVPHLEQNEVVEERDCWMVYFPQGHSIRIIDKRELERQGFNLKPRMVDMDTGDLVDAGGDPYDFVPDETGPDIELVEDDETAPVQVKRKAATA